MAVTSVPMFSFHTRFWSSTWRDIVYAGVPSSVTSPRKAASNWMLLLHCSLGEALNDEVALLVAPITGLVWLGTHHQVCVPSHIVYVVTLALDCSAPPVAF